MLHYAWVFLVLAIIAAIFGFGGMAVRRRRDREDTVLHLPRAVRDRPC